MEVTKPYKSIGFGAMDVTKPYKSIGSFPADVWGTPGRNLKAYISNYRLVTHFKFLIVGPDQKMALELVSGANCG